jgi:hypothetical protein
MYLPPTMLPHGLRVLVDPPIEFPEARDDASQLASSSLWSRLRTTVRGIRPAQANAEPCQDSEHPAPRSLLRRSGACTE